MKPALTIALLIASTTCGRRATPPESAADDPSVTDGDKYKVLFANERVRVLRYHDDPGGETHLHRHPPFLMYALAPFRRQLTFPDGTTREKVFQAGDVAWMPEQRHIGKNIGATPTDGLLIEIRDRCD